MSPENSLANLNTEPNRKDIGRVDRLAQLALNVVLSYESGDPIEPVLLKALIPHLIGVTHSTVGGSLRAPLTHAFSLKSPSTLPDGIALRKLEGGIDKQLRAMIPEDYPSQGHIPELYSDTKILDSIDGEELFMDYYQPLRYNDPNTYKIITSLINTLAEKRWDYLPTVVDMGRAFGHSTQKIKKYDKWPFSNSQALLQPPRGLKISPDLPYDMDIQRLVESSLDQNPKAGRVVGYDLWPPTEADLELGSSETFLMSRRLRDPKAVEEFHQLFVEDSTDVDIWLPKLHIDATNPESLAKLENGDNLPNGKADIFILSGVVLQFPPEKLKTIFQNFQRIANPGALAIINEWAYLKDGELTTYKGAHWQNNGGFKTYLLDLWNLEQPPTEVCRYTNRQCENMVFSKAGREIMKTGVFHRS